MAKLEEVVGRSLPVPPLEEPTTRDSRPRSPDARVEELIRQTEALLAENQRLQEAARPDKKEEKKEKKPEDGMPLFWKLCSAALLTVTAMVVVTLYNQLSLSSGQVRADLGAVRNDIGQMRNELVSKEDYNLRLERTVEAIKELQAGSKAAMENWRERTAEHKSLAADLRQLLRESERELQMLRERVSAFERRETAPAAAPKSKTPGK